MTTGGTGLTPRDVTPQATAAVIDYEIPGIAEAMRADGRRSTPFAALSRGIVGVRGGSLVVNVPGSPKGALESLETSSRCLATPWRRLPDRSTTRPPAPRAGTPARRQLVTRDLFEPFAAVPFYPLVFVLF